MNAHAHASILSHAGSGGNRELADETLDGMKEALEVQVNLGEDYWQTGDENDEKRLNLWEGQTTDGRKWSKAIGKQARPFDGCSDQRVQLIEFMVLAKVAFAIEILTRAQVGVVPVTARHSETAARVATLVGWMEKNLWKSRGRRQAKLMANWFYTDGFSALAVNYHRETLVVNEELTFDGLLMDYRLTAAQEEGVTEEDLMGLESAFRTAFFYDEDDSTALDILRSRFPGMEESGYTGILSDLRENQVAQIPVTLAGKEGSKLTALRVKEDIFFDREVSDIQEAPYLFQIHRLTYDQVLARAEEEEWSEAFVNGLVGKDDEDVGLQGQRILGTHLDNRRQDRHSGREDERYEVVMCLRKATDDQGRMNVYKVVFHPDLDEAATEDRILEDAYGQYPVVVFTRECLSNQLLDSRGWPEVMGPAQSLMKWLLDMATNVTALKTLPPLVAPTSRRGTEYLIAPLAILREQRVKELRAFTDFEYPKEALDLVNLLEAASHGVAGLPSDRVSELVTEILQMDEAKDILAGMEDVYSLAVTQMLHHMPPDMLEEITGSDFSDISSIELAHQTYLRLSFDPRHLNKEFVKGWLETLQNMIIPMDPGGRLMRDRLLEISLRMWDPSLADMEVVQSDQAALGSEQKAEQEQISAILNGFDPEILEFESGADFTARYEVLQQWKQGNPEILGSLPDAAMQRLVVHEENLQQQVKQVRNIRTGQTGVTSGEPQPQGA